MWKTIILILILTLVSTLLGCSDTNNHSDPNSLLHPKEEKFYAEDKGKVALFVVGDELDGFELEKEGINIIQSIFNASSFKGAQKKYPFLKLKKEPAYVVFDDKKQIFKTNDFNDLVRFLKTQVHK